MPDRIVREGILESERVNALSFEAEVFYRRLMSKADDYGRYNANGKILRASLYPLQLDRVSLSNVSEWLSECQTVGLITVYTVDGKPYLEIHNFGQRMRQKREKWPPPPCCKNACVENTDFNSKLVSNSPSDVSNPPRVAPTRADLVLESDLDLETISNTISISNSKTADAETNAMASSDLSFSEFVAACSERRIFEVGDTAWRRAAGAWKHLSFEQKIAAVQDVRKRDPDAVEIRSPALPANYLADHKFERPHAPSNGDRAARQKLESSPSVIAARMFMGGGSK